MDAKCALSMVEDRNIDSLKSYLSGLGPRPIEVVISIAAESIIGELVSRKRVKAIVRDALEIYCPR